MSRGFLFYVILLFALVPARAKIFAQNSKEETTGTTYRNQDIHQTLFLEGVDSVLASLHYSRENISIDIDTARRDTLGIVHQDNSSNRIGKYIGKLVVNRIANSHQIINSINGTEEGIYTVSASGVLCCLPSDVIDKKFYFSKSRKYRTVYEGYDNPNELKSFWDSTAKPILVTIGAVAVIALFFLIRG